MAIKFDKLISNRYGIYNPLASTTAYALVGWLSDPTARFIIPIPMDLYRNASGTPIITGTQITFVNGDTYTGTWVGSSVGTQFSLDAGNLDRANNEGKPCRVTFTATYT